jgi:hypothetical protein
MVAFLSSFFRETLQVRSVNVAALLFSLGKTSLLHDLKNSTNSGVRIDFFLAGANSAYSKIPTTIANNVPSRRLPKKNFIRATLVGTEELVDLRAKKRH